MREIERLSVGIRQPLALANGENGSSRTHLFIDGHPTGTEDCSELHGLHQAMLGSTSVGRELLLLLMGRPTG